MENGKMVQVEKIGVHNDFGYRVEYQGFEYAVHKEEIHVTALGDLKVGVENLYSWNGQKWEQGLVK